MIFDLYPVQERYWETRIRGDPHLYRIFKYPTRNDITLYVKKEIYERLNDNERPNWVVIQITGETGEFKSSVGITIIKDWVDKGFNSERIAMEYQDFEDKLYDSKPRQSFMLDEEVFQHGLGSARIRNNMVNIVETLRQRQNSIMLCTPREKHITDEHCTFTLEPCGFNKEKKVVRCLVRKNNYLGFCYINIKPYWNGELWNEYQEKKKAFLEISRRQEYGKFNYDKYAEKLINKMPEEYKSKKKRIVLWVEKNSPNITKEERELLVEQIVMKLEGV